MDFKDKEENGVRTRSFRYEDYNNRRAFLRSYPLDWEGGGEKEDMVSISEENEGRRRRVKKIFLSVFHWGGGKVLIVRKVKHKVGFYLVACFPFGFKPPTALISV